MFASGERITKPFGLAKDQIAGFGPISRGIVNPLCRKGLAAVSRLRRTSPATRSRNTAIPSGHGPAANSTQSGRSLPKLPDFTGVDSMPVIATDLLRAVPSIIPSDIPTLSDDECLLRLAQAIEDHDSEHLDEIARLIGRLIVTIE